MTDLQPQCENQYSGVQTEGDLNGAHYDLIMGDPMVMPNGGITLYQKAADGLNNAVVWEGGTAGITSYDSHSGATFDADLHRVTGLSVPSIHVVGAIVCAVGNTLRPSPT